MEFEEAVEPGIEEEVLRLRELVVEPRGERASGSMHATARRVTPKPATKPREDRSIARRDDALGRGKSTGFGGSGKVALTLLKTPL